MTTWRTPARGSACRGLTRDASISDVGHRSAGLVALLDAGLLLDLAADVLHRLDRAHARDHVEVVLRRRRGGEPLERVRLPRIGPRDPALLDRAHDVDDRQQHAEG